MSGGWSWAPTTTWSSPFPCRELELPIRAILRAARPPPGELCAGSLRLYEEGHRVLVDGRPLTPSRMEFRALGLLMEQKGRVVRREEFLDRVWSEEAEIWDRAVDTLVRRLRHALGPAASRDRDDPGRGLPPARRLNSALSTRGRLSGS